PENLHVSLLFLGEVDVREVLEVCRSVAEVCAEHPSFDLSVETAGGFPNARRPRVLWVGMGQGIQELCCLHDDLEGPLLELGCYRREGRRYVPHVTLGRVKGDRPPDELPQALAKHAGWKGGVTRVEEVQVLSSELRPQGPVYTILSRARLS